MEFENLSLNYERIINGIRTEFAEIFTKLQLDATVDQLAAAAYEKIKNLEIHVEDEEMFIKEKDLKPNSVHIVVKFGAASVNILSSVCNVTLVVWGSQNKVKPVQELLSTFVSQNNLKFLRYTEEDQVVFDQKVSQVWTLPTVNSNFTESGNAFRSLFNVNGQVVIGQELIRLGQLTYTWEGGSETIPFIAFNDNFSNALNPQPFGNTFGFSQSEVNFSTYVFTISTYNLDCQLNRDILAVKGFRYKGIDTSKASKKSQNDTWDIVLEFDNGYSNDYITDYEDPITQSNFTRTWKLKEASTDQAIGKIPSITMVFSH